MARSGSPGSGKGTPMPGFCCGFFEKRSGGSGDIPFRACCRIPNQLRTRKRWNVSVQSRHLPPRPFLSSCTCLAQYLGMPPKITSSTQRHINRSYLNPKPSKCGPDEPRNTTITAQTTQSPPQSRTASPRASHRSFLGRFPKISSSFVVFFCSNVAAVVTKLVLACTHVAPTESLGTDRCVT